MCIRDRRRKGHMVFADVPHLYKLLRNHFLDDGLSNNKHITKTTVEKLLALDNGEFKLCPKLSHVHLTIKGRERQRVFLVTKLFSNTTAEAIRYLFPEEHVATFFKLINDSFDILNSRRCVDNKPLASGFGTHHEVQEGVLKKMYTC